MARRKVDLAGVRAARGRLDGIAREHPEAFERLGDDREAWLAVLREDGGAEEDEEGSCSRMAKKKPGEHRRPGRPRKDDPGAKREAIIFHVDPEMRVRLERYRDRLEVRLGFKVSLAQVLRGFVEKALRAEDGEPG